MKKHLVLIFSLSLVLFAGSSYAFAAEQNKNQLSPTESLLIKKQMENDGASQDDIKNVIKKLESGKPLDSEKALAEGQTVYFSSEDIEKAALGIEDNSLEKTLEFDDGSYIKVEIEVEDEGDVKSNNMNTMSTGTFKRITVKGSNPWSNASYKARVYLNTHLGNNYIDKVEEPSIHTWFGTYSDEKLKITRKYEDRKNKITAKSHLTFKYTNYKNFSARTFYLKMHTGDKLKDRYGIWVSYTEGSAKYE